MSCFRADDTGLLVRVKLQPGARRPGVLGQVPDTEGTRLKIAVTAPPEDGRANRAACAALAEALGVAASAVHITQGATSRQKTLHVLGDADALAARLRAL